MTRDHDFSFRCDACGSEHAGMPTFGFSFPIDYMDVPEQERTQRTFLTEDLCVIDDKAYFVRGCLELPVHGTADPFVWGVWLSVGEDDFFDFQDLLGVESRAQHAPMEGRLASPPGPYPDSTHLGARLLFRDSGLRPLVQLHPANHPLVREQREGISKARLAEIYDYMVHRKRGGRTTTR
jgi:hypothetical protein